MSRIDDGNIIDIVMVLRVKCHLCICRLQLHGCQILNLQFYEFLCPGSLLTKLIF